MKLINRQTCPMGGQHALHYDHTDGNSVFGPDVEIIGHEFVRHAIADLDVLHREPLKTAFANMPIQIESLKKQLGDAKDPAQRATIEKQLAATQAIWKSSRSSSHSAHRDVSSKMTIYGASVKSSCSSLGGHTQGDTVVFCRKKNRMHGDLMESRLAYMGDAMFDEWISTLETLKNLDSTRAARTRACHSMKNP